MPDPFGPALSPLALALVLALGALYLRGLARPRAIAHLRRRSGVGRGLGGPGLAAALGLWAVALNAPLAPLSMGLFSIHQLDHLLLRLLAPLLFVLARPGPVLAAGLPRPWRRRLRGAARPLARLRRLPVAFVLLVGWFYLWQWPAAHALALSRPALLLAAHLGMALAGVNFFAAVLDARDTPEAHLQAPRLMAVIGVILSNILLGAPTTLKTAVVYTAYGTQARLWNTAPLADETVGGYTIWVASSLVMIATLLLVIGNWNRAEARRWARRNDWRASNMAALEFPQTAAELRLKVGAANRRMGWALALAAFGVFVVALATAILIATLP